MLPFSVGDLAKTIGLFTLAHGYTTQDDAAQLKNGVRLGKGPNELVEVVTSTTNYTVVYNFKRHCYQLYCAQWLKHV